jgi:zinc and cadmium transporter
LNVILWVFLAVLGVSLISLIGIVALYLKDDVLDRLMFFLIAFAAGTLLGAAFLDLLPEAMGEGGGEMVFPAVLFGILVFFIMERFIHWRHCHEGYCDVHAFSYLNLVGDGIHNFLDGMIIAWSFLSDISLGIVTTTAIVFHELPQEMGDFAILVYGGFSRAKALLFNFLTAVTSFLGAALAYLFFPVMHLSTAPLLAFAAGTFIYIASTDLMPELHKEGDFKKSMIQFLALILGIAVIWGVIKVFE